MPAMSSFYMPLNLMATTMLLLLLLSSGSAFAQSSSSSSSCTSALVNLSPCLNYITGNETKPSSSCCSQLGQVVQTEPQCLCMVLNGGAASSLGITIDQKQAVALPGACNVQTPPVSKCNDTTGDNSAPATPTTAPSGSSGSISRTLPNGESSDGALSGSRSLTSLIFYLVLAMATSQMLLNR